jgi:DNA-binding NarL/FixJ family response regulator
VAELARRAMLSLPKPIETALEGRFDTQPPSGKSHAAHAAAAGQSTSRLQAGSAITGMGRQSAGAQLPTRPDGLMADFAAPIGPVRRPDFGLSKREVEVLALIAEGRSNPEIGRQLYITRKTVAVHVSNILTKLGVSGRVEAAAAAIRLGLTDRD